MKMDKQIANDERRRCIDLLDKPLNITYQNFLAGIDSYSNPEASLVKKRAETFLGDISLINKVLLKMREHGRPRQLIFIAEHGDMHDLIHDKAIDPEEMINLALDKIQK
jgi:hypothetical protein